MTNVQKSRVADLACFGGPKLFDEARHVGRPNIGNRQRFLERIDDILERRWFTNDGPYVRAFEKEIASLVGVRHCIAICNATIALEIVTRALGMTGEVIVPSFTFVATPHSLQWQEITPVFCDIDESNHSLDPSALERLITPRTSGIIGVHVWGEPCKTEALEQIAMKRNLRLVFDAAHAFAVGHRGRMVGSFGDAEVFSFHATKFLNSFEGGAIVTNDDELAAKARLMRNFGFCGVDRVDYIGTNGKMTEVSAAMGLTSLESLDDLIASNRRNYEGYAAALSGLAGVRLFPYDAEERRNFQYVVLEIDEAAARISRDALFKVLWQENVLARRYFFPGCHQMEPYRSYFPHAGLLLPHTERVTSRVLSLPTGSAVSAQDIQAICHLLRFAVNNGEAIAVRLRDLANV